jgi:hypothetical protein
VRTIGSERAFAEFAFTSSERELMIATLVGRKIQHATPANIPHVAMKRFGFQSSKHPRALYKTSQRSMRRIETHAPMNATGTN